MTLGADPAAQGSATPQGPGPTPAVEGETGSLLRELALLALLLLAFTPLFLQLAAAWSTRNEYGHGALVPLVSLYALLRERPRLARLPRAGSSLGLVALAASLAVYAGATAAGILPLAGLAFPAALASGLLWLRGAAWLRALAFPIAFLCFAVPLPESWLAPLVVQLRLFVSGAAVALLQGFSVPVAREGNVLLLPGGGELFVADACSGVSALVTLLPLAVLLAWATERRALRRAALVASVVPIALAANLARVVATVLAALRFGTDAVTEAAAHESLGLLVYVGGCLALLAVGTAMRRLWPAR